MNELGKCPMQQFVNVGYCQMWSLQLPPISQLDEGFLSPISSLDITWPR